MDHKKMNCLLSGSRGLLGSAFVDYCKDNGIKYQTLLPFPCSMEALKEKLSGGEITHFINCAGYSNDYLSRHVPYEVYQSNFICVLNQLESIRKFSPKTAYVNFGSVYEKIKDTPYASSKRAARELIHSYRKNYDIIAHMPYLSFTEYCKKDSNRFLIKIIQGVMIRKEYKKMEPLHLYGANDIFRFAWATDVCEATFNISPLDWVDISFINPTGSRLCDIVHLIQEKLQVDRFNVAFNSIKCDPSLDMERFDNKFQTNYGIKQIIDKLIEFELSQKSDDQTREIYGKPT